MCLSVTDKNLIGLDWSYSTPTLFYLLYKSHVSVLEKVEVKRENQEIKVEQY